MDDSLSMAEIEAEGAVSLPNKEVLSLLDVNANVDLGLDLAAPVDLAAAANLNVAAPIEASATANVLSPNAQAVGVASQHGLIDQGITGSATAHAPQHAAVAQNSSGASGAAAPGAASGASAAAGAAGAAAGAAGAASTTGGVDSLLHGGSLLDANVNLHANANLAAPIDGAVAANGNVAAPVDAAVGANVASPGAVSEALAPQSVDIVQNLDHVSANATAAQVANVAQK